MANPFSSDQFLRILMGQDVPPEVRILKTEKQFEDEFYDKVFKHLIIVELIADYCLEGIDPFSKPPISESPNQTKPIVFSPSEEEIKKQEEENLKALERVKKEIEEIKRLLRERLNRETVIQFLELSKSSSNERVEEEKQKIIPVLAKEVYDAKQTVRKIINWEDIRQRYCKSMNMFIGDAFTVANTITAIAASGVLVSLSPMLWAIVITAILRIGVMNFCRELDSNS